MGPEEDISDSQPPPEATGCRRPGPGGSPFSWGVANSHPTEVLMGALGATPSADHDATNRDFCHEGMDTFAA